MISLEGDVTFEERFCFKLFLCGGVQNQCKSSLVRLEKKVQFTILLENSEQDFRLLMNDLSNLLKRKNVWRGTIQIRTEVENVDVNH